MKSFLKKQHGYTLAGLATLIMLQGCATQNAQLDATPLKDEASSSISKFKKTVEEQPLHTEVNGAYLPVSIKQKTTQKTTQDSAWLKSIKVNLNTVGTVTTLADILKLLAKQGVNIASEVPLERYKYTGFNYTGIDAQTALRTILAGAGLDMLVDGNSKLVTIKPLGSKTWYLNTGNRTTEYSTNGSGSSSKLKAVGTSSVTAKDSFWDSLKTELDQRTQIMVQSPSKASANFSQTVDVASSQVKGNNLYPPPVPSQNVAAASGSGNNQVITPPSPSAIASSSAGQVSVNSSGSVESDGALKYEKIQIATYAINPETGGVTVQGPAWLLEGLEGYFKNVQEIYNTSLVFEGELVMVTIDKAKSEGISIANFSKFANTKYGLVMDSNQTAGGYTVSIPYNDVSADSIATSSLSMLSKIPSVTSSGIAAPALGLYGLSGLQIFNNYLSSIGEVTTLQKPVISTTSGVPGDFRKTITRFYNSVSQTSSSGSTGSAATATGNTMTELEFGTILRVNPRYDPATQMVRVQIELTQTTMSGTQTVPQSLTSGNSIQQVSTQVPITSRVIYSGEALMKDGDMIVMGGQSEEIATSDKAGVTGLMDVAALAPVVANGNKSTNKNEFYFAMKAKIVRNTK